MRRTPIVVVAAALLALGACGGGGKKAVNSASGSVTTSTTATGDPGTTAAPAAPAGNAPAGSSAAPATTAKPATPAKPAATPAPAPAPPTNGGPNQSAGGAATPTYTGKPQTVPGKYHYTVTGTASFGSPPPGADLVVDAPSGSSQHSKQTSHTDSPQGGSDSSTDTTLDYQVDGVHLVDLTTTSSAGTLQFHPSPAPLIFPASFAKGATVGPFKMTSTDGKEVATVKVTIQEVGVQVTTNDKQSHPTIQAEVDTTLECAQPAQCQLTGTLNSTRWLGYDGLELKDHSTSDIMFGTFKFNSDTTSVADKASPS